MQIITSCCQHLADLVHIISLSFQYAALCGRLKTVESKKTPFSPIFLDSGSFSFSIAGKKKELASKKNYVISHFFRRMLPLTFVNKLKKGVLSKGTSV